LKTNKFYTLTSIAGFTMLLFITYLILPYIVNKGSEVEGFCITLLGLYVLSCVVAFFGYCYFPMKLAFVSDLVDNPTDPVYKYDDYDLSISKYIVDFKLREVPLICTLFPLCIMFWNKGLVRTETIYLTDEEYDTIFKKDFDLKTVFEGRETVELQKEDKQQSRIKSLNKDYYNNFR